jgi:hypothetical protein
LAPSRASVTPQAAPIPDAPPVALYLGHCFSPSEALDFISLDDTFPSTSLQTLLIEPDVFHAPAIEETVDHEG